MEIRTRKKELEARLKGQKGSLFSKPSGKLERTWYADNRERLKITIKGIRNLDGKTAVVSAGMFDLATIPIENGAGRYIRESDVPGEIPDLEVEQEVEVKVGGKIIMSGRLYQD